MPQLWAQQTLLSSSYFLSSTLPPPNPSPVAPSIYLPGSSLCLLPFPTISISTLFHWKCCASRELLWKWRHLRWKAGRRNGGVGARGAVQWHSRQAAHSSNRTATLHLIYCQKYIQKGVRKKTHSIKKNSIKMRNTVVIIVWECLTFYCTQTGGRKMAGSWYTSQLPTQADRLRFIWGLELHLP